MAEFWTPDINWRAMEGAPDDVGEIQGREALRRYYQDWIDMFDNISVIPEELLDGATDHAASRSRLTVPQDRPLTPPCAVRAAPANRGPPAAPPLAPTRERSPSPRFRSQ